LSLELYIIYINASEACTYFRLGLFLTTYPFGEKTHFLSTAVAGSYHYTNRRFRGKI